MKSSNNNNIETLTVPGTGLRHVPMVIQPLALDGLHHWLPWNWHDGQKNATNMVGEMEPIPGTKGMGFNLQSPFY